MSNNDTERYNGWANRETWAVALHINNDQGWRESVLEQLREARAEYAPEFEFSPAEFPDYRAGDIIRENVEEVTDPHLAWDNAYYVEHVLPIVQDIGSAWRVDWTELGRSFLEDLADIDPDGEAVFTNYPGRIYLDPETGEFSGTAEGGEDMPSSS